MTRLGFAVTGIDAAAETVLTARSHAEEAGLAIDYRAVAAETLAAAAEAWDRPNPADALDAVWRLIRETNAYLEANEPWKADPGAAVDAVMGDALEALRVVSVLAWPAMPSSCTEAWRRSAR